MIKNRALYLLSIPTLITAVSGVLLVSSAVLADDSVVDEINVTVPISCSMSGTGMNTHNANIMNGTYQPNIGTTVLHIFCNDSDGFAVYAAGYTGDAIGETNSNKLVGTSASSGAVIDTGLATSGGSPDVSNWAMKLAITQDSGDTTGTNTFVIDSAPNVSGGADASFSQYHTVPNEYTKVAHKNSTTDMTASTGGVKLTTTYAAYISKTQAADTYSGQVIYTLVHPSSHSAPSSDACNPEGTTIGTNSDTDIQCMQDFASLSSSVKSTLVSSMTEGTQYTLIDKRDNKTYTLAKMANNKVWMTQNLDLDLDENTTYTNEDTDLGWNTSTNTYGNASWSPLRSTYETTADQKHAWCQGGTWALDSNVCDSNETPESYDAGDLYWSGTTDEYWVWNDYEQSCSRSGDTYVCDESINPIDDYVTNDDSIPQYHLGNYYNWAAAIASNDASVYYETDAVVPQSICPAGWTLPSSNYNSDTALYSGDFLELWTGYGWTNPSGFSDNSVLWSAPLYFPIGGSFYGVLMYPGFVSTYYSSRAGKEYGGVHLVDFYHYNETTAGLEFHDGGSGFSVRCMLR